VALTCYRQMKKLSLSNFKLIGVLNVCGGEEEVEEPVSWCNVTTKEVDIVPKKNQTTLSPM